MLQTDIIGPTSILRRHSHFLNRYFYRYFLNTVHTSLRRSSSWSLATWLSLVNYLRQCERNEHWRRLWNWSFCPSFCVCLCTCTL